MNAPEVDGGAPPDDAEAIATARAEFWMRWRGELASYGASRRQPASALAVAVSLPAPPHRVTASPVSGRHTGKACVVARPV
ncbi:hypothetical protein [Paraburkholderia ultramafica]|uniref:hypothetical protein n=1 Tax=Paraburkholderia ultramafica TaxID=1544867 RepID=UPI0015840ECC|nr:hypothetical protein [Paraburkholderia ultramafica]